MRHVEHYPSKATVEPWLRLAVASVLQAVDDLLSPDALTAVDALLWWLSDEPLWWLSVCGHEVSSPESTLLLALGGGDYAKQKHKRRKLSGALV